MKTIALAWQGKILSLLFLSAAITAFVILLGIFKTSSPAFAQTEDPKVDLSITPASSGVASGQNFNVDIEIDGKTNQVSAANIEVDFDPEFLEVQTVTPGTYLKTILAPVGSDNPNGKITLTLGAPVNSYPTGKGTLATLQFKAQKDTPVPTRIIINPESAAVTAIGHNTNMLGAISNGTVSIGSFAPALKTAFFDLSLLGSSIKVGEQFGVTVRSTSSVDEANLFSAVLIFDPDFFEVINIETVNSFITQWASTNFDNTRGQVKLIGGVPSPGFKTPELGSNMANITFKAKKSGSGLLTFDDTSAIFRNSDNADILSSKTPLLIEVSPAPSPTPTPIPVVTPTPSLTPTPTPVPSATPEPLCAITAASWNTTKPVTQGMIVSLNIAGFGNCHGKQVAITVKEDDGLLGTQNVVTNPDTATFNGTSAQTSWVTEYQPDGIFGVWDPPEYFFNAQIMGNQSIFKSSNRIIVNKLLIGQSAKGDGDYDGTVNLKDLSMIFTYWNQTQNFPLGLDMNDDNLINSFDFSGITKILLTAGIL